MSPPVAPLDRNRTGAQEELQPTTGLWLFLLNAANARSTEWLYGRTLDNESRNSCCHFRFSDRCAFLCCNPRAVLQALKVHP
jgi:hypothetical protein